MTTATRQAINSLAREIRGAALDQRVWSTDSAYQFCERMATSHYENFPVGSLLVPRRLRKHFYSIYAFARIADDFADERYNAGHTIEERLELLDWWLAMLRDGERQATHPVFVALSQTREQFDLPLSLFEDLLSAFRQDVTVENYSTFDELLDYCRRSANPIGRLILLLFGYRDEQLHTWSDHICTALQLANHWQDVAIDLEKNRVYLPLESLEKFGLSHKDLSERTANDRFKRLLAFEVERARNLFDLGKPLCTTVRGRLGLELRAVWLGGMRILERIGENDAEAGDHCSGQDDHLVAGVEERQVSALLMASGVSSALSRMRGARRKLATATGSNFYYSFLLLPSPKRRAIKDIYAFCRLLDDIVDEDPKGRDPSRELDEWREEIEAIYQGAPSNDFGERLLNTIEEFDLPKQPFQDLIDGMEMDLKWHSYRTFADLREYCYRAASAVGLICIEIFGYESVRTREYAVNLGLALQLTNILRDLKEDAARGRTYIPLEELERFGYSENDLRANRYNTPFVDLMRYQHTRARSYFEKAAALLPEQDRPAMFAGEIMGAIYREMLEQIPSVQYDVFRNRIAIGKSRRFRIALGIWLKSKLGR
jgi:phytoene synthase